LKHMYEAQMVQQKDFNLDPAVMNDFRRIDVAKDMILGLHEEVVKLASYACHYKAHVLRSDEIRIGSVADAVADVVKYSFVLAQLFGINEIELYDAYMRKTDVVADKARGERVKFISGMPVLIFDLDNVIADLTCWDNNIRSAKTGTVDGKKKNMVEYLESMKREFYTEGGFTRISEICGARDGLKELKRRGWCIVIISARPVWQYKQVYSDTVRWLREKDIAYDLLLFNKDKAEAIYEKIFPAVPAYLVEDRIKHVLEVAELDIPVLVMSYPHNAELKETDKIIRVNCWNQILDIIGEPKETR
jgi:hypothetical protein